MSEPEREQAPSAESFRLQERLRVRWSEVDMQKIVFNGHYMTYADTAVSAYWRAMAMAYESALLPWDGELFLRRATVDYWASARYDDLLHVGVRCGRIGNTSLQLDTAIFKDGRALVGAELIYVFAQPSTQTPRRIPDPVRQCIQAFESGSNMLDVRLGDWSALLASAMALRTSVFHTEQGIDLQRMSDAADADALHSVVFNRLGQPVATGRLVIKADGQATIGRMAVLRGLRGAGLGSAVLSALMDAAAQQGVQMVSLNAQQTALAFYRHHGFESMGEPFTDAGLQHIQMVKHLPTDSAAP